VPRGSRGLGSSFNGLWFATGTANLGDGIVLFSLPLLALSAGASDGLVALTITLATIAWPMFGIHGGWFVDRVGATRILRGANLVRGLALLGLAVAVAFGALSFWLVASVAVLYGIAEVLVDTALVSTVASTVIPAQRGRANARIEATINVANQFLGSPIAGALIVLGNVFAVAAGGVLYLLALVGVGFVRRVSLAEAVEVPDNRIRAGMSFLWKNLTLRWLTVINAGMNLVWGMWEAVIVLYIVAPGPLGHTPFEFGLLLAGMAVGGLAASLVFPWLRTRLGIAVLLSVDVIGTALLPLAPALGLGFWWVLAAAALAAAGSSTWRILMSTIRQHQTPEYLLGRVYSASRVVSWGAVPVGAALASVLVTVFGLPGVFTVATGIAIVVIVGFVVFAVRHPLTGADGEPVSSAR